MSKHGSLSETFIALLRPVLLVEMAATTKEFDLHAKAQNAQLFQYSKQS